MKEAWLFLTALAAWSGLRYGSEGCGVLTHTQVLNRALEHYDNPIFGPGVVKRVLLENGPAFQAGVAYPDIMYNPLCKRGTVHDVAEEIHWGRYQEVAWNYFRKTYPDPVGNKDAEAFMAFMLGTVSHQVADVTWHNLASARAGFIQMIADTTYGGDYKLAHSAADNGVDLLGASEWDNTYMKDWYVPSEELAQIITEYFGQERIKAFEIQNCAFQMNALRLAEQHLGHLLYPIVSTISPMLMDEAEGYFEGGLEDMTSWTMLAWDSTLYMAKHGPEACQVDRDPLQINCPAGSSSFLSINVKSDQTENPLSKPEVVSQRVETVRAASAIFGQDLIQAISESLHPTGIQGKGLLIEVNETQLGQSLDSQFKAEDLLVPNLWQHGRWSRVSPTMMHLHRHLSKGRRLEKPLGDSPTWKNGGRGRSNVEAKETESRPHSALLYVNKADAKLGHSIHVADVDGDGREDAIIGAPGYMVNGSHRQGCLFILTAPTLDTLASNQATGPRRQVDIEAVADNTLCSPEGSVYQRFGHSVAVCRNSAGTAVLYVGAPGTGMETLSYRGQVYYYVARNGSRGFGPEPDGTLNTTGSDDGDSFRFLGQALACHGSRLVASGKYLSPQGSGAIQAGALFSSQDLGMPLERWAVGSGSYDWSGHSMVPLMHGDYAFLAVSSPNHKVPEGALTGAGKVEIRELGDLAGMVTATLSGDQPFESFGHSLAWHSGRLPSGPSVLAVGSPAFSDASGSTNVHAGKVTVFDAADPGAPKKLYEIHGRSVIGRLGKSVMMSPDGGRLFAGAPRFKRTTTTLKRGDNENARVGEGAVYVFNLDKLPEDSEKAVTDTCSSKVPCPEEWAEELLLPDKEDVGGFFGETLASWGGSHTLVSAPRSSKFARQSGVVYLFGSDP